MKKPSAKDLREYAESIGFDLDVQAFIDHYESNGWKVGKTQMVDWKAAVRNWRRRAGEFKPRQQQQRMPIRERNQRINELNERKAYWMRAPESAKRDRMLEQIRVELQTL